MFVCKGVYRSQKAALDSLELELQALVCCLVWVLGLRQEGQ